MDSMRSTGLNRRRRFVTVMLAAVMLAALLAATSAASSARHRSGHAPKSFFGVATPQGMEQHDPKLMHKNGVGVARFGLLWPYVQPSAATRNWGWVDRIVGQLAANGVQAVPYVWGTPRWLSHTFRDDPLKSPAGKQGWKLFLKAAVDRYGPGGTYWTQPGLYRSQYPGKWPKPIRAWQIWNEPTLKKFFPHRNYVHRYAKMLKLSHQAIKAEDRHAKVVLAGVPGGKKPSAAAFLTSLYRVKGIKRSFEAAALHPYSRNVKELRRTIQGTRKAMRARHDSHTPLWLTEIGWGSGHPNKFGINKGIRGQAQLLKQSFKLILHNRRRWKIHNLSWFTWRDPPRKNDPDCSFCSSSGLLKHNFKPKPALRAYRQFAKRR
jgi:polysaccharide biosynthesis protein PslG